MAKTHDKLPRKKSLIGMILTMAVYKILESV